MKSMKSIIVFFFFFLVDVVVYECCECEEDVAMRGNIKLERREKEQESERSALIFFQQNRRTQARSEIM